jgi:hypothetical protein
MEGFMRIALFLALLIGGLLVPGMGSAQVYRNETPPPLVTAAGARWQLDGGPIFHAGSFYYPAGATVFFDGKIMVRTGVYEGVPLYADVTLEPYSIVYVPVGGTVMRPYERRRDGELTGTVGSRTPSFPIVRDVELSAERATTGLITPAIGSEMEFRPDTRYVLVPASSIGQLASAAPVPEPEFVAAGVVSVTAPARSGADSQSSGLWIDFNSGRWFSAGRAVNYDPDRFVPAGDYRGFPVYTERSGVANRIFVTVVRDGPVAPFERR